MKVLLIEPYMAPRVKEIEGGLESLQREVDGNIEAVYPSDTDPVAYVVNEEGKLAGLPLNRAILSEDGEILDVIAGTFLVVGLDEDSFCSLPDGYIARYTELFRDPEVFVCIEGELRVIRLTEGDR